MVNAMTDVILLFGGTSEERLVSVASAQNLATQYDFADLIFQDKFENLYRTDRAELSAHQDVFLNEFKPKNASFAKNLNEAVMFLKDKIIFLGFHGTQGENGEVQSLFEMHKIKFTGSGANASHLAFEKNLAKDVMKKTDTLQAFELLFEKTQVDSLLPRFEKLLAQYKKLVFKPTASGSSIGLHIVADQQQLSAAIAGIKKSEFRNYLVENFIKGRELTVTVTQKKADLKALPASEIIMHEGRSFDYEGKYLGEGSTEITPAQLTAQELQTAQALAVKAHQAFGCYGYSRTDMILAAEGAYFLETNTLPGLSKPSFVPQQLLAADIAFKNFIEAQIELAEKRYS